MNGTVQIRLSRNERGQGLIEFGLIFLFLVTLVISILEMSLFLYNYSVLTDAAKEGVRYAVVHGSSGTNPAGTGAPCGTVTSGAIFDAVRTYAKTSVLDLSKMGVDVCYSDGSDSPGSTVNVKVRYQYSPLFGLVELNWAAMPRMTISATSVGRIQF